MAIGEFGGAATLPADGGAFLATPMYWFYELGHAALNPSRAFADATRLFFKNPANPLAHTAVVRTADGTSSAVLPYFFLERYVPSYLREWQAFVHAVRTGEPTPVSGADARAPLVIGLAAWRSLTEGRPVAL